MVAQRSLLSNPAALRGKFCTSLLNIISDKDKSPQLIKCLNKTPGLTAALLRLLGTGGVSTQCTFCLLELWL